MFLCWGTLSYWLHGALQTMWKISISLWHNGSIWNIHIEHFNGLPSSNRPPRALFLSLIIIDRHQYQNTINESNTKFEKKNFFYHIFLSLPRNHNLMFQNYSSMIIKVQHRYQITKSFTFLTFHLNNWEALHVSYARDTLQFQCFDTLGDNGQVLNIKV